MAFIQPGFRSKASFRQASRSHEYSAKETRTERAVRAKVDQKAQGTLDRSNKHFAKHRNNWIAREYGRLVKQDSPKLEFTPPVKQDRSAILKIEATRRVDHRQAQRIQRIDKARVNTIQQQQTAARQLERGQSRG